MPEWWTYSAEDFLLFSPRTYWRLIERHNEALWPAQLPALLLGIAILWLLLRPRPWSHRAVAGSLAVLWGWVAWSFLWERYATINWAAAGSVTRTQPAALLGQGADEGSSMVVGAIRGMRLARSSSR